MLPKPKVTKVTQNTDRVTTMCEQQVWPKHLHDWSSISDTKWDPLALETATHQPGTLSSHTAAAVAAATPSNQVGVAAAANWRVQHTQSQHANTTRRTERASEDSEACGTGELPIIRVQGAPPLLTTLARVQHCLHSLLAKNREKGRARSSHAPIGWGGHVCPHIGPVHSQHNKQRPENVTRSVHWSSAAHANMPTQPVSTCRSAQAAVSVTRGGKMGHGAHRTKWLNSKHRMRMHLGGAW